MNTTLLLMAACAIALVALSLVLWQNAQLRARQKNSYSTVEQHLRRTAPNTTTSEAVLLDSEASGNESLLWRHLTLRAGIAPNRTFYLLLILPGIALVTIAAIAAGPLPAACTLVLYALLQAFRIWLVSVRRHQKMVRQLPIFLDTMVRLATIGNSIESCFQATVPTVEEPLRELMERANRLVKAGVDLEHALLQEARVFKLKELELVSAVIGVAMRFGGRADTVLDRMGSFMRDREAAQNELAALSAETRMSAWILALLPIGLGLFMIIFNGQMFTMMLSDPTGRKMLIGAAVLEFVGAFWLYRLARSV